MDQYLLRQFSRKDWNLIQYYPHFIIFFASMVLVYIILSRREKKMTHQSQSDNDNKQRTSRLSKLSFDSQNEQSCLKLKGFKQIIQNPQLKYQNQRPRQQIQVSHKYQFNEDEFSENQTYQIDQNQLPIQKAVSIKQLKKSFIQNLMKPKQQSLLWINQTQFKQREKRRIDNERKKQQQKRKRIEQMKPKPKPKPKVKQPVQPIEQKKSQPVKIQQKKQPSILQQKPSLFSQGNKVPIQVQKQNNQPTGLFSSNKGPQVNKDQIQNRQAFNAQQPIATPKAEQKPNQKKQQKQKQQVKSPSFGEGIPLNKLSSGLFQQKPATVAILPSVSTGISSIVTKPLVIPTQAINNAIKPASVSSSALQNDLKENISALKKMTQFATQQKISCQIKTQTNNFANSQSNLRDLYDSANSFISTINPSNAKQSTTFAIQLWNFIFLTQIPSLSQQQGWERFPPRMKNQSCWKRSINTYVMKINFYRIMGHQNLWLIIFGKLLKLLEWMYTRNQNITTYKDFDLFKNGYIDLKGDKVAVINIVRVDFLTYFLFCMTTFDPQLFCQYLVQKCGQDKTVLEEVRKYNFKWKYNFFWILVQSIMKNPVQSYFKPIVYMNILSSIYLQVRRNKQNKTQFKEFEVLTNELVQKGVAFTKRDVLKQNVQIKKLGSQDQQTNNYTYQGEQFLSQMQNLTFYFQQKLQDYKRNSQDFDKRCSIFEFFVK